MMAEKAGTPEGATRWRRGEGPGYPSLKEQEAQARKEEAAWMKSSADVIKKEGEAMREGKPDSEVVKAGQ